MIALVDCNNFYCSCERLFRPDLIGKPVVVLSNNDGCAIARSDEAKALGIEMGAPEFQIRDKIKEHNIAMFSSNYTLYGDMSERVMKVLKKFVEKIEVYSIDESFLDMSDMKLHDLNKLAVQIKHEVFKHTGIPVSVGIAPTKTLAKMANRYAKKHKKLIGTHVVSTEKDIDEMLSATAVEDVWGIGRQSAAKLKNIGIVTAYDVKAVPVNWMRTTLTVVGERLWSELKGIPCIPFELVPKPKKNMCTSRSFGKLITEKHDIGEAVANFAAKCAFNLRKEKSCASKLIVFIHTNEHRKQDIQYRNNICIELKVPSNSTIELIDYALQGLNGIFRPGINYMKAGVIVEGLVSESEVQASMFDMRNRQKEKIVNRAMDSMNKLFGTDMVRLASQGYGKNWRLKNQYLSQRYTTSFKHLKTINI